LGHDLSAAFGQAVVPALQHDLPDAFGQSFVPALGHDLSIAFGHSFVPALLQDFSQALSQVLAAALGHIAGASLSATSLTAEPQVGEQFFAFSVTALNITKRTIAKIANLTCLFIINPFFKKKVKNTTLELPEL